MVWGLVFGNRVTNEQPLLTKAGKSSSDTGREYDYGGALGTKKLKSN
jgi:hypothetical protein